MQSEDSGSLTTEKQFTITVNDVNDGPTDIALDSTSVDENSGTNAAVGDFSTTDEDAGDTFTYSLVAGAGDTDNGAFTILGSTLRLSADVDFENDQTSYSIRVQSEDSGSLTTEKQFTITVNDVNDAPFVAGAIAAQTDDDGDTVSVDVAPSFDDVDAGDSLTFSVSPLSADALPAGLSISGAGVISGTLAASASGSSPYSITIRAEDVGGLTVDNSFTWTVNNVAPTTTGIGDQSDNDGDTINLNVSGDFSDGGSDTDALTFSDPGGTLPPSLSINGAGVISGTLDANASVSSPFSVTIRASDGDDFVDSTFTWTVSNVAPTTIGIVNQTSSDGDTIFANVSTRFDDGGNDSDSLTITDPSGSLPPSLSVSPTGIVTGTLDDDASVGSPYTVTLRATDPPGAFIEATFSWTVNNVNPVVPTPIPDQSENDGAAFSLDVSGNFADGGPDGDALTFSDPSASLPGGLGINGAGVISGNIDMDASVSSPYSVTIRATDAQGGFVEDTFQFTVGNPAPTVPTPIVDQSDSDGDAVSLDTSTSFADEDVLTFSTLSTLPGGLALNPVTGELSGTLDTDASIGSVYSITVTATDAQGATASDTFTWTVSNEAPVVGTPIPNQSSDDGAAISLDVSGNFEDGGNDTDALTFSDVGSSLPPSLSINGAGVISGTLDTDASNSSPYTVTIRATDAQGASVDDVFTWTVSNVDPVVTTPIADQTDSDADAVSLNVSSNFSDGGGDSDSLSFSDPSGSLPDSLSISLAGVISGTLDSDASNSGPYSVTIRATDDMGGFVEDTFTWTVNNPAPIAVDDSLGTFDEEDSASVNALDGAGADSDPDGDAIAIIQVEGQAVVAGGAAVPVPNGEVNLSANGKSLSFTPDEHYSGAVSFDYTISDGTDTATATVTGTITAVADVPTLSTGTPLTTGEDVAVGLGINANLVDTDGSEELVVQISGVPAGAEISDGVNSSSAFTTDVSNWTVGAITIVSAPHDDTDIALTVTIFANETSNGDSESVAEAISVTVNPVSDIPNLTVADVAPNEDTTTPLTISASLVDTDGSETFVIELTGVEGSLSAGTDNGGGSWTLNESQLAGLTLTPIANSSDDFVISVEAIAEDAPDAPATNFDSISVDMQAVADAPTLSVADAAADEDTVLNLSITGALVDTDGSEVLTYELTGVEGTLSAGTDNGGGSWTLAASDVAGLQLTPIEHSSDDFVINVSAVATDDASTANTDDTIAITLTPISDTPTLTAGDVTGDEDTAITLDIVGALVDDDGSEVLTYELTGVSGTLSAGTDNGGGSWSLTEAQALGLTLTPPANSDDDFSVTVEAIAIDAPAASANSIDTFNVTVDPVSDAPTLTVADASGNEDTAIPLSITSALVDTDGTETLTFELTGVSGTLSAGTDNGGGSWSLVAGEEAGLTVTPPADDANDFVITVEAVATDGVATPASTVDTIAVTVNEVNDAPVLDDQVFSVDENAANGTVVGTLIATNVETFETLAYELTGTAFAIDSTGEITVADSAQLDFETTTIFNLTGTVTDDGVPPLDDTGAVDISVNDLNDNAPIAGDDPITVAELDTASFDVIANDTDADLPPQTLSVSEVNGDGFLVGTAVPILSSGKTIGELTIQSDGSATFVATPDITVEEFSGSATYTVTDGLGLNDTATIAITITPINDNQPDLTTDGTALEASGIDYEEDEHLSFSPMTLILSDYFLDLDIDEDGLLDSSTSGDLDSLVFSVVGNTDPALIQTNINGTDLEIWSPNNYFGTSDLTIRATDTANPPGNISNVDLTFTVSVEPVNDAPLTGGYSDEVVDEDSGPISLPLLTNFTDADLSDFDPSDEELTFTITIVDKPNEFVTTGVIDESNLVGATITNNVPAPGQRTIVYETTMTSSLSLELYENAHGEADVTVRGEDLGRPPLAPADPLPLFDEDSFTITVNAVGDDTPMAVDDHYNDFPELIVSEDGDSIVFDPTLNDDGGDVPVTIIVAGAEFVDDGGGVHRYRSGTRQADPLDIGSLQTVANGQVSCADAGCQDNETADTTIDASAVGPRNIVYKPEPNFHGEDSFIYCIQDDFAGGEPAFVVDASDPRCATVTVLVEPVNDLPVPQEPITFVMAQAGDLECGSLECLDPNAQEGLLAKIRDIDNTHIDGQGCDPLDSVTCPSPTSDTLYFNLKSAITDNGQLLPPFNTDGSFTYQPDATFAGEDSFVFDVCDSPDFSDPDSCVFDVRAYIVIEPLDGAPPGSVEDVVEFDFQLSQVPLELVIGPEPNVLLVNDDSGSMDWDILTDESDGIFFFDSGESVRYVMKATAGSSDVAASEEASPGQGLWRLRNSSYNTVYYNPEIRYTPWEGLDTSDNEFPDSPPTAARHNPLTATPFTNLTVPQNYTGLGVEAADPDCDDQICIIPNWFGSGCAVYASACPDGDDVDDISVTDYYIPRYYIWDDKDSDGDMDATPSPATDPDNAEGILVEIKPASDGGSDTYTKYTDRTDCTTIDGVCTYDEELQNFANWFTYSRNREFTAKSALGKVVADAENIRIGYAKLNSSSNIVPIKSMNSSARTGEKADLLDAIYQTNSSGGTPLRRALRDAGRHYECRQNDIFNSGSNSSPGDAGCPVLAAPDGNCQQNFTLLMSDGAWNGGTPSIGDADDDNNTNFDGGRYAGSTNNTLADVAMYYYERDLHTSLDDEVPTTARDQEGASATAFASGGNEVMHQHMTTFTVGFGVNGLVEDGDVPTDYTVSFNWGNPNTTARKIDDARHAALNGRGDYLSAGNANELADALVSAFEEFSSGSGAASAVSFNSQEIQEETLIFRAFYNTKINTGDLVAIPFTDAGLGDTETWSASTQMDLVDADDREILTYDPDTSTGIPFRPGTLNDDQKSIFIDSPPLASPPTAQQNTEITQRVNYLRGDPTNERPDGSFRERPINNGRLGDIVHSSPVFVGPPDRLGRDAEPFPQGSDLYSGFASTNASRQDMIYVAANDGMLHGFNADTGDEVFGYVPNNLMLNEFSRNITNLLDFNYEHRYFVDLTPAINDVYINVDGDYTGDKEWVTMLVGGHGAGAKAYFALNITDPDLLTEANAEDVVLWEFTEDDDAYPTAYDDGSGTYVPLTDSDGNQRQDLQDPPQPVKDLGYTFSVPTLAMSNIIDSVGGEDVHRWVGVAGNGYNSTAGIAKLFVFFLEGGMDGIWCHPDLEYNSTIADDGSIPAECVGAEQDFVKLNTGFGVQDGLPNGLGIPRLIDVDGNGTVDYVYAGDYFGNLFRFDMTSSDYDDWSVTKIFEAAYDPDGANVPQPITTQPIAVEHPSQPDGYIIIFATGSYITVPDGTSTDIQSIYGIWDRLAPELISKNDLVQQRYTNVDDPDLGRVRFLSANDVDYDEDAKGWYNDLDSVAPGGNQSTDPAEFPGERAIRRILLRGGLVFVNSVIPKTENSCIRVAGGALLSFCPETGGANCVIQSVFDVNNDGEFDELVDDNEFVTGVLIEEAKPPTDSGFLEDKLITQIGEELFVVDTDTKRGDNTGRISWKQLRNID